MIKRTAASNSQFCVPHLRLRFIRRAMNGLRSEEEPHGHHDQGDDADPEGEGSGGEVEQGKRIGLIGPI